MIKMSCPLLFSLQHLISHDIIVPWKMKGTFLLFMLTVTKWCRQRWYSESIEDIFICYRIVKQEQRFLFKNKTENEVNETFSVYLLTTTLPSDHKRKWKSKIAIQKVKCIKMCQKWVQNESKWVKMSQNASKWVKMSQNKSK